MSIAAQTSPGVALRLGGVRRAFPNGPTVLADFSLDVEAGEFVAILGPSGCGKSTLLRLVARLIEPDAGTITTFPGQPRAAFVFQDAQLLPWRSVLDNAALPLELQGVSKDERYAAAREVLGQVGLAEAEQRYPAQLSGGMRMRVSLARALVTQPSLLLMDEPFAALDEITRFHLEVQLRKLWQARGMTILFVTHSISEAAFLANRAIVLSRKGGQIKLDHLIHLPLERTNELRSDPRLGQQMNALFGAMEEEEDQ